MIEQNEIRDEHDELNVIENIEGNQNKKKCSNSIKIIIFIALIIITIIILCIMCLYTNKRKNLIHIILNVSKSLKEPYEKLILKKEDFNYNSLLKNIEFYSYFDRTDIIANIIGTKQGNFFDIIGLLTELDSKTNEDDIQEKINDYENQEIYKCYDPAPRLKKIYKDEISKIDKILKSFSDKKKCVLLYYVDSSTFIKGKVEKNFKNQIKEYEATVKWYNPYYWFVNYKFNFPEKEFKDKIRTDMINLLIKEELKFEDYKEKNKINKISEVYKAIKSINNKLIKFQEDDITINNILGVFKGYIEGDANLEEALINAENIISNIAENYENKIILLITDKWNNGGNLEKISEKIKKEKNTYIIVIYISSKDLNRPGELFDSPLDSFTYYEKDLFEATSLINSEDIFFLGNKDLIIPEKIKLFIQGTDKTLMNAILESFKNFIDNNELLLFSIGKDRLNEYLGNEINMFEAKDQGDEGTCYAYASATAIHLTLLGYYGESSETFEEIKNNLVNIYGRNGSCTREVLEQQSKKYKYRIKEVDEKGARQAINNYHICVARFSLTRLEMSKFTRFFDEINKTGILTKKLLETTPPYNSVKNLPKEKQEELKHHAIVLISAKNGYLRFLNSWGENFGDHGFFSIENSEVLRDMEFYEVYIDENDLTQKEKNKHENFEKELSVKYFKDLDNYKSLCNEEITCPICEKSVKIKDFKGSIDKVRCPKCNQIFDNKDERLAKKLYFDFINK